MITLGIIGIVAALTMPALVTNYQKKVLSTRIAKFYSVFNQAINAKKAEDNSQDTSMLKTGNNPDQIEEYFNVNFAPYMKTIGVKKKNQGIVVGFPDGSGMYMRISGTFPLVYWCVDYKMCDTANGNYPPTNPRSIFLFYGTGFPDYNATNYGCTSSSDRECLIVSCKQGHPVHGYNNCSNILQLDNWEIKDDYPW